MNKDVPIIVNIEDNTDIDSMILEIKIYIYTKIKIKILNTIW